jgi:Tfp pilus assembly protein PilX
MKRRSLSRGSLPRRERGIVMIMALIILVMVTLLAVSSFRVSNTNLKVVSSMQGRQEAVASAQAAIEQVISSAYFTEEPAIVAATPITVDINNDGTADYTVAVAKPACVRSRPTQAAQLNLAVENDRKCLGTARVGAGSISSFCSDTIWEVSASTADRVTGASTTVRQGVAMRVSATDALSACK